MIFPVVTPHPFFPASFSIKHPAPSKLKQTADEQSHLESVLEQPMTHQPNFRSPGMLKLVDDFDNFAAVRDIPPSLLAAGSSQQFAS